MGIKRMSTSIKARDVYLFGLNKGSHGVKKTWCQLCRQLYWPIWVSLLCLVVILTLFNLFISLHLINFVVLTGDAIRPWSNTSSNYDRPPLASIKNIIANDNYSSDASKMYYLRSTGRFDNSRKYLIHDFVYRGEHWSNLSSKLTVTLAAQTSIEHLYRLVELSQSWLGLISVGVFVPGEDCHIAMLYLELLIRCFPSVKNNVSIHFIYPANKPPKNMHSIADWTTTCYKWPSSLKELIERRPKEMMRWRSTIIYPQNHLRNVARKGCQTSFVYLIDIDIIPRYNLAHDLSTYLQHPSCEHCAFVIPTYEVNEYTLHLPKNKSALLQLIKKNYSQPFHKSIFIHNQFATNSSIWESLPEGNDITVAYPVTNFEMFYEPFYVSRDDVPPHDERFIGYGFTRNTQVYEMHIAGYKFVVLNYAFAMHRGFLKKRKKNAWRERQNRYNSILFKSFKKEVHSRYKPHDNSKTI